MEIYPDCRITLASLAQFICILEGRAASAGGAFLIDEDLGLGSHRYVRLGLRSLVRSDEVLLLKLCQLLLNDFREVLDVQRSYLSILFLKYVAISKIETLVFQVFYFRQYFCTKHHVRIPKAPLSRRQQSHQVLIHPGTVRLKRHPATFLSWSVCSSSLVLILNLL